MNLQKWTSPSSLPSLFENFFGQDIFDLRNVAMPGSTLPAVNIKETADTFEVEVAAPGMKKEDFNIEVNNNILTISSEKETKKEVKEEDYTRKEFSYQSFQRSFTLPQTVSDDKIIAKYTEGVLNIIIPKKEEAKKRPSRRIDIQ